MPIHDVLAKSAAANPHKLALVEDSGCTVTYGELLRRVETFSAELDAYGFAAGARVAVILPNSIDYVVAYFAIARAGLVSAHIAPMSSAGELAHMLALASPSLLIVSEDFDEDAAGPAAPPILRAAAHGSRGLGAEWDGPAGEARALPDGDESALAITFSGGSTGVPKGIVTSHRARMATAAVLGRGFEVTAEDVIGVATPLFHSAGLFSWLTPAIWRGNTIALLSRWSAAGLARLIVSAQVTKLFLVPTQMYDLAFMPKAFPEMSRLRGVFHAAAPASDALIARFSARWPQARLTEFYGLSETGTIAVNGAGAAACADRIVGRAVDAVLIKVVDGAGHPVPAGEVGEIVVSGDQNFVGYLGDDAGAAKAWRYGRDWFATGDLGRVDRDRNVTLCGREKEVVNRGGVKFFPAEVENALMAHPSIVECAVVPVPDDRLGAVPVAAIVMEADWNGNIEGLTSFLLDNISGVKRPVQFLIVDALPRNAAAKVDRQRVKRDFLASGPLVVNVSRDWFGQRMTAA